MNGNKSQLTVMLITALLGAYLAGYGVLRARCEQVVPQFIVVPTSTPMQADALITFYKPLFYAEQKWTGRTFSVGRWGLAGF